MLWVVSWRIFGAIPGATMDLPKRDRHRALDGKRDGMADCHCSYKAIVQNRYWTIAKKGGSDERYVIIYWVSQE